MDNNPRTAPSACGACGESGLRYRSDLSLYLPDGSMPDSLWRCPTCGSYARGVNFDDPEVQRHFDVTRYTPIEHEPATRSVRSPFLRWIAGLISARLGGSLDGKRVLDIGATYGILADICKEQGASCSVVEVVAYLRDELSRRGYPAYASPDEIPTDTRFDAIAMIDSLYYVQDPATMLRQLHALLAPDGS